MSIQSYFRIYNSKKVRIALVMCETISNKYECLYGVTRELLRRPATRGVEPLRRYAAGRRRASGSAATALPSVPPEPRSVPRVSKCARRLAVPQRDNFVRSLTVSCGTVCAILER